MINIYILNPIILAVVAISFIYIAITVIKIINNKCCDKKTIVEIIVGILLFVIPLSYYVIINKKNDIRGYIDSYLQRYQILIADCLKNNNEEIAVLSFKNIKEKRVELNDCILPNIDKEYHDKVKEEFSKINIVIKVQEFDGIEYNFMTIVVDKEFI